MDYDPFSVTHSDEPPPALTRFDRMVVTGCAGASVALLLFPWIARAFEPSLRDAPSLSLLTQWSLTRWFPASFAAVAAILAALGATLAAPLPLRRRCLQVSFVVAYAGWALCMAGLLAGRR